MNPGLQQAIDNISTWLQLIITVGAVVTLLMTVSRAAQRPNKTQDERLDALEKWKTDVENRLEAGTSHFDSIDEGNTVVQNSLLAIMDALISGNNKAELQKQRNNMYEYLTKKGGIHHD